jgi:hypothetical protein
VAAANARNTSTRHAARTSELPAGPTTNARDAALPTWSATGALVLATGATGAVGAATTTRVQLVDDMSGC